MTRLAVVGSREFSNPRFMNICILRWQAEKGLITEIVTGGAPGADSLAKRWAIKNNIPCKIFDADWKRFGKSAGVIRNNDIVDRSEAMIAFPSSKGIGTQNSISLAKRKGIPVREYWDWK